MTEKIEAFWVDATSDDVARIANTLKPIAARARDEDTSHWRQVLLAGWKLRRSGARWIDSDGTTWNQCQVYREPSWWLNKPDPGPGWRLLGKLPDEPKLATDEAWFPDCAKWYPFENDDGIQLEGYWYRRRIEAVEPEPKHYVLRAGDSCETPCGNRIDIIPQGGTQRCFNFKVGDTVKTIHGQTITITAKGFEVTQ
jgi:hypothetical protein